MHQQVVRGRIQAGVSSFAGVAILVPEGAVFNTPCLCKHDVERAWVTDNHGLPVARKLFAEKGVGADPGGRRRLERHGLQDRLPDTDRPKMAEFVAKGGFVHGLADAQREAWAKAIRPGPAEMLQAIGGKARMVCDALAEGKKVWAEKHEKK